MNRNGGGMDGGDCRGEVGEGTGRRGGRRNCCWDINSNINNNNKFQIFKRFMKLHISRIFIEGNSKFVDSHFLAGIDLHQFYINNFVHFYDLCLVILNIWDIYIFHLESINHTHYFCQMRNIIVLHVTFLLSLPKASFSFNCYSL